MHKAFQDNYPEDYSHCYGCGRSNEQGLHLRSFWDGDETVCRHTPRPYYTGGYPGLLYGGMIASLLDCHGAGTASGVRARETGQQGARFVTASLKVDFLKPTPIDQELEIRGKVLEVAGRKVTVELWLKAGDVVTAKGLGIFVEPKQFTQRTGDPT